MRSKVGESRAGTASATSLIRRNGWTQGPAPRGHDGQHAAWGLGRPRIGNSSVAKGASFLTSRVSFTAPMPIAVSGKGELVQALFQFR